MKTKFSLKQPQFKAKIIGTPMILIGIYLLFSPSSLYLKIGFSSIFIGFFIIIMITEKSIPQNISKAQIDGNRNAVKSITKELNLKGNAIFIPKSDILTEERVFIPLQESKTQIPDIDNDFVLSTGSDGRSLGLALPPSGQNILYEIENEINFENINISQIEEKLKIFIGMDIIKSVSLEKIKDKWKLEIKNNDKCKQDIEFCKQFPCPSCSTIFTAITKALNQKIQILDAVNNGKKIIFYFSELR